MFRHPYPFSLAHNPIMALKPKARNLRNNPRRDQKMLSTQVGAGALFPQPFHLAFEATGAARRFRRAANCDHRV